MNSLSFIAFYMCVLVTMAIQPICSIRISTVPSRPALLLCGDYHDTNFMPLLELFITAINGKSWSHPVSCVIEVDPKAVMLNDYIVPAVERLIKEWGRPNKSVKISAHEPRTMTSDYLETTRRSLIKALNSTIPQSVIDEYSQQGAELPKDKRSQPSSTNGAQDEWVTYVKKPGAIDFEFMGGPSVKDYVVYLEEQRLFIVALVEKYKDDPAKELFQSSLHLFDEAYEQIKRDLSSFNEGDLLTQSIRVLFLKCSSNQAALERYQSWRTTYLLSTDYNYFDLTVVDRILSYKGAAPLIYYLGDIHAKRIEELLKKYLGWQMLGKSYAEYSSPVSLAVNSNAVTEFQGLLPLIMNLFYRVGSEQMSPRICDACNKQFNSLKSCAKCMQAQYCGPTCQKQHWEAGHKQECKIQCALAQYAERATQKSKQVTMVGGT